VAKSKTLRASALINFEQRRLIANATKNPIQRARKLGTTMIQCAHTRGVLPDLLDQGVRHPDRTAFGEPEIAPWAPQLGLAD
jgi:hypothetical protein